MEQNQFLPEENLRILTPEELQKWQTILKSHVIQIKQWGQETDSKILEIAFHFELFLQALVFATEVGELADSKLQYPYNIGINHTQKFTVVTITFYNTTLGGLTQNEFTLAALLEKLYTEEEFQKTIIVATSQQ